jgi:hypothetical protein
MNRRDFLRGLRSTAVATTIAVSSISAFGAQSHKLLSSLTSKRSIEVNFVPEYMANIVTMTAKDVHGVEWMAYEYSEPDVDVLNNEHLINLMNTTLDNRGAIYA